MFLLRLLVLAIAAVFATGCLVDPAPTRFARDPHTPAARADKALVVFVFPRCEPSADSFMCERDGRNRIRVVEHGARFVTELGVGEYAASFEEPGRHRFGALHRRDHCAQNDRIDCIAALDADLQAGKTYFVTFAWKHLFGKRQRPTGRLDFVVIDESRERELRALLVDLRRVEPDPEYRQGPLGLRNVAVSSHIPSRLEQDREDGRPTPRLD